MSTQGPLLNRIIFRLKVTDTSETDDPLEIVNAFLSQRELALNTNQLTPHYIHIQPQGNPNQRYHLILDMNHAEAPSDIKIQDIHYEMYRVRMLENKEP